MEQSSLCLQRATVPKLTVILRKAYGGGYIANELTSPACRFLYLHGRQLKLLLWALRELQISYSGKRLMSAADPDGMRKQKVEEYRTKFANPYVAASRGYVDAVIETFRDEKISDAFY